MISTRPHFCSLIFDIISENSNSGIKGAISIEKRIEKRFGVVFTLLDLFSRRGVKKAYISELLVGLDSFRMEVARSEYVSPPGFRFM